MMRNSNEHSFRKMHLFFVFLSALISLTSQNKCVLRTYDFRALYTIYFKDINVVTMKIIDSNKPEEDINYFADAIGQVINSKQRKKPMLLIKHDIFLPNTENTTNPPVLGVSESLLEQVDRRKFRETTKKIKTNSRDKEFAYIILVWNEHNLNLALNQHVNIVTYNRGLYFIVFVENVLSLNKVFRRFWHELDTFNVMASTLCYTASENNIFVYNPFEENGSSWGIVKSLNVSAVMDNPNIMFNFMNNFNGYPIHVSLFGRPPTSLNRIPTSLQDSKIYSLLKQYSGGYGGVDGCLIAFLAKKLNFTSIITDPADENKYGYILDDGFVTGSLGDVSRNVVDISANGRFMVPYGVKNIEFTQPVLNSKVCPIVPKAEKIPQWLMILHGFTEETWILILIVIIICCCVWYLITNCHFADDNSIIMNSVQHKMNIKPNNFTLKLKHYINNKSTEILNYNNKVNSNNRLSKPIIFKTKIPTSSDTSLIKSTLDIIAIFLNMPIKIPVGLVKRIFIACILALNVIINGIFQGTLVRSFSTVFYYPDINTLEELDNSGLPIATSLQVFSHDSSELISRLAKKVISINETGMMRAAFVGDVAAMERTQDAQFLIRMYYTRNGHPLLHVAHECPSSYFITYIVPKNSKFLPKFNSIILDFFEAGLVDKWYDDFVDAIVLEKGWMRVDTEMRKPFALTDIQSAFYVLLFGGIISLIVFIGELTLDFIFQRYGKNKIQQIAFAN